MVHPESFQGAKILENHRDFQLVPALILDLRNQVMEVEIGPVTGLQILIPGFQRRTLDLEQLNLHSVI